MSSIAPLMPRQTVPALSVPPIGSGPWTLADQKPENFTMVVFYRGLHCPICGKYLADLNSKIEEFAKRGVEIVVISSDSEERAAEAKAQWKLDNLTVGYGLDLDVAVLSPDGVAGGAVEPHRHRDPGASVGLARLEVQERVRRVSGPERADERVVEVG